MRLLTLILLGTSALSAPEAREQDDEEASLFVLDGDRLVLFHATEAALGLIPPPPIFSAETPTQRFKENVVDATVADAEGYVHASVTRTSVPDVGQTPQALTDGVPVSSSALRNTYKYFSFTISRALPVAIVVTPTVGDPDLYIAWNTNSPTASQWTWSSSNERGADIVVIAPDDPRLAGCPVPCVLYIGVFAFGLRTAIFTVSATAAARTALTAGIPAAGLSAPYSFSYFELSLPATAGWVPQAVEFAVTPLASPRAYLYVNAVPFNYSRPDAEPQLTCSPAICPTTWGVRNARWSSFSSASTQRVLISPTDPNYLVGTYIVGVLALDAAAPFSLVGYLGGGFAALQDGVPLQDAVALGAYQYYRLTVATWGVDVSVTVTAASGDPDLYVSSHASNRFPNASANDAASRGATGVDAVYFPWQTLAECQAAIAPDGTGGSCDIWIGVHGYSAATYTVVATTVDGTQRTLLLDGEPQGGVVGFRTYAYYEARVSVSPGSPYSLYLRSLAGDADVYARTDGLNPSSSFYHFASTRATGDDIINVVAGMRYYAANCTLSVAVYGYTNATYALTYSSSSAVVELRNGIVQGGVVGTSPIYNYYFVAVPTSGTDIFFALTALAGDADIYVSVWSSPTFRPTTTAWTWKGDAFGSDAVFIAGADARACGACNYIVAVTCAVGVSCVYGLAAIVAPATVMPLVDGQPVASAAAPQSYRYFTYDTGGVLVNVTFASVALTGDVELYVTNKLTPPLPSAGPGGWMWSSAQGGNTTGSGVVTVPASDPRASPPARFTVAAFCISGPCAFGIVAVAEGSAPQTLLPGTPTAPATLAPGGAANFILTLSDATKDLVVAATALDGAVIVAMSPPTEPAPACGPSVPGLCTATWLGAPNELRVAAADPCNAEYVPNPAVCALADWAPGQFFITVYAPQGATFTLAALTANVPTRLLDGAPQDGQSTSASPPTYLFQTPADASLPDVRISVTSFAPSSRVAARPLLVWVTSCFQSACTPSSTAPGPANYAAAGAVPAGDTLDLFISRFSPAYCAPPPAGGAGTCNYYIQVTPASLCLGACVAPLTIVAQRQGGSLTRVPFFALDNVTLTQPGNVASGRAAVFELYLAPDPVTITARLDSCGPATAPLSLYSCDPSIGAARRCTNAFQPSAADNTAAASTSSGAGTARIVAPAVAAVNYFLAVANDGGGNGPPPPAGAPPASYSLVLSAGGAPTLWPGALPASLTVAVAGTSVNVSWAPAVVGSPMAPGTTPLQGVVYTLFAAAGGFAAGAVPSTACGLLRWAAGAPPSTSTASAVDTSQLSLLLEPETYYEFGLLATCDRTCWARSTSMAASAAVGSGVGAPGYATQRIAYVPASGKTGAGSSTPAPATAFPVAGMVSAGIAAVAVVGAGFACWHYRRRRADDGSSQYAALDEGTLNSAMTTIAVPSAPAITGFLSAMKRALAAPATGSAAGSASNGEDATVYAELSDDSKAPR